MDAKKRAILTDTIVFLVGLVIVLISGHLTTTAILLKKITETAGIAILGYSIIDIIKRLLAFYTEARRVSKIDSVFSHSVILDEPTSDLPKFIGTNIEGCITPLNRGAIDIRRLSRLRQYCDFLATPQGKQYPPIIISTGRSQGYTELLAQILGLAETGTDLPFIIENGAAIYHVVSKTTITLLNNAQKNLMKVVREKLIETYSRNEFEHKSFIVTINPIEGAETIESLYQTILLTIERNGLNDEVDVVLGNTAVDVMPAGINKLTVLKDIVTKEKFAHDGSLSDLNSVVYVAESNSDLPILEQVGLAFCSEFGATNEVRKRIETRFGRDNIIEKRDLDVLLFVIEKTCHLRIL